MEINAQILEVAKDGKVGVTQIMFGAAISYNQAQEYLRRLKESGLLEYFRADRKFKTSAKGLRFLQSCSRLSNLTDAQRQEADK